MLENLFNYENMYPTARPDHAPDATNLKTTLSYRQELESLCISLVAQSVREL